MPARVMNAVCDQNVFGELFETEAKAADVLQGSDEVLDLAEATTNGEVLSSIGPPTLRCV